MDFVPNHTSDQHEWFIKSLAGEEPYRDYYVWKDGGTAPNNWVRYCIYMLYLHLTSEKCYLF